MKLSKPKEAQLQQASKSISFATQLLPPLVIAAATCIVYANSLRGVFLFDDVRQIVDNREVRQLWPLTEHFGGNTRVFFRISLAANYAFGGLDPLGYHVVNITVHLLAGLLLYGPVRRTLRLELFGDRYRQSAGWIAMASALIWTVHPLQTESVTYIVQRCESMMGLSFLLCLYCVARGAASTRPALWYAGSWAALCLGLGCKEIMITAPLVLVLYDRTFLSPDWGTLWRRRGWLHALCLLPLLVALGILVPRILSGGETVGFDIGSVSSWQYARSQPGVILHYLQLSLVPHSLCLDYQWPVANSVGAILIPSLAVGSLLLVSLYGSLRFRPWAFLGTTFFLVLAPTSSFVPVQDLAFEHRMYLPLSAVVITVVLLAWQLFSRLPRVPRAAVATSALMLITVPLAAATVLRNQDYTDGIRMWTDVVGKAPWNYRAHNNLGELLTDADRTSRAIEHLQRAVELNPAFAEAHANLARAHMQRGGNLTAAREHLAIALQLRPGSARFVQQRGMLEAQQGRLSKAREYFERALQLDPADPVIMANLGNCLFRLDSTAAKEAALKHFEAALAIDPDLPRVRGWITETLQSLGRHDDAYEFVRTANWTDVDSAAQQLNRLALRHQQEGRFAEALDAYQRALDFAPTRADLYFNLGNLLRQQENLAAAQENYQHAVRFNPDFGQAHNNLAALLVRSDPARAIEHFRAALRADPNNAQAHNNLANSLARSGKLDQAINHYRAALRLNPDFELAARNLEIVSRKHALMQTGP